MSRPYTIVIIPAIEGLKPVEWVRAHSAFQHEDVEPPGSFGKGKGDRNLGGGA